MTIAHALLFHDVLAIDERPVMCDSYAHQRYLQAIAHQGDWRNLQPTFKAKPRCSRNGWAKYEF
jgi:hypothetical protein